MAAIAVAVECAGVIGKASNGVNETEFGGAIPMPRRVVVCGEPVALSATESAAEKPVTEDGVKVM